MGEPDRNTGRILVVGGYGAVGGTVCAALARRFPGRVAPAGRDLARAEQAAAALGSGETGVRLDIADPADHDRGLAGDVAAVVLCVEPPDAAFARSCLERGVHLVDVGASDRLHRQVEESAEVATRSGATALLSVGLAPGLTNLLARRAHEEVGGAERIDLTVLLGGGERHGADAVRWTVDRLSEPAEGSAAFRVVGLPGFGPRRAYPFPFSDQHSLRRTLGVPLVTTRLCLDSAPLTGALFGLRRTGALAPARNPGVRDALVGAMGRVHLGSDRFAIRADAVRNGRWVSYALTGRTQSRVTGLVAAHAAEEVLTGATAPGVHHLDRVDPLAGLPWRLAEAGVTVWIRLP